MHSICNCLITKLGLFINQNFYLIFFYLKILYTLTSAFYLFCHNYKLFFVLLYYYIIALLYYYIFISLLL